MCPLTPLFAGFVAIVITDLKKTEESLGQTKTDLQNQEAFSQGLQTDIARKDSEIFVQDQNIIALSEQIKALLNELRIVDLDPIFLGIL